MPDHVQNFAFYGAGDSVNADISAAYMAAHVDIVEDDGNDERFSAAFKAAGGKMAVAYVDPTFVPYCPPPFKPPAGTCRGPVGTLVAGDESAWLHDATGARVHRYDSPHYLYQEVLNPGSASAQRAFAQTVKVMLGKNPALDGVFADDSGGPLSNLYYKYNANGVEFQSDVQWIAAESAMFAAAGVKVLYNGGEPAGGPAYGGAFLTLPEVIGQVSEDYIAGDAGLRSDRWGFFQNDENGILAIASYHKLALCLPEGPVDSASRTYIYAAFMLVYDPQYTVYGQDLVLADKEAIYPETQLVPQRPLATASGDVALLRKGGVYVREFAACSIASVPVGPCAAVLNSSTASAALPPLAQSYAHRIALDSGSVYHGGAARIVSGTPSSLGPVSAVILVR